MPNWIEGSLRVKGTKERIMNFLRNGIADNRLKYEGTDLINSLDMPIEKYDKYGLEALKYSHAAFW